MARRIVRDGYTSPVYALVGPTHSCALRHCMGDRERADQMVEQWRAWRDRYAADWVNGRAVPPPPHRETLGVGYARPTA